MPLDLADISVSFLQNELDGLRSEIAALRQSIGKNKSADSVANGTRAEAMPGGKMV